MSKISLVLLLGLVAFAAAKRCCMPGQVLTEDEQCQDLATGKNSSISLKCIERMVADRREMNYFVNYAGQLQFPTPNRIVTYERGTFCNVNDHVVLICDDKPEPTIDQTVYGYCMGVSAIFLILTAVSYTTNGLHKELFGKSVINLCVSLALGMFIFMVMAVMEYEDMNWCAVRGFSAYYLTLVSFFWMNAISIQSITARKHGDFPDKDLERRRYITYALYAWGTPAIFTVFTAIVNFMPGDHLKPGIGLNHCWFFDKTQQWEYMYSIMTVLTVVNIVIFAANTSLLCCSAQTHTESFKQKFANCIRLFIVMGIPWVFEMVSSLTPHHLAWEIIDLFNALQGIWIFIVLVLFRTKDKPEEHMQYKINITSTESPYSKLERSISENSKNTHKHTKIHIKILK